MPEQRGAPPETTGANAKQGKAKEVKPPTPAERKLIELIGRGKAKAILLEPPAERAPVKPAKQPAVNGKPKRPQDSKKPKEPTRPKDLQNPSRAKEGHCYRWDGTSGSCREGWFCLWQFDHVPGMESPWFTPYDSNSSNGSSRPRA